MKSFKLLISAFLITVSSLALAQNAKVSQTKVAVLGIDVRSLPNDPASLANLTRLQLQKMENFIVFRQYDVEEEMKAANESLSSCLSVKCLSRVGNLIGADQMLTGSIESFGDRIMINFVLIDVQNSEIKNSMVNEYYHFPNQLEGMIELGLNKLFNLPSDPKLANALEKHDIIITEKSINTLNLSGPRMGITYVGGGKGDRLQAAKNIGGYNMIPVMSQFGYQVEAKYMSAGNMQALIEFIPLVTGMDQGRFIPSITFMNGFRHSKTGWEFAFGPTISVKKVINGYYDESNNWHLLNEWYTDENLDENGRYHDNPNETVEEYDSRGQLRLSYGFTFAAGKTFTSGHLNMPINLYLTPAKDGFHLGASFGFNSKNKSSE
ncbi:MAG: hypothetical protein NWS74_01980 [Salibacteraceae bacterium]|jgi:hypothetical protein|nr:hypothetical protein [Salibacteraceae bacterium]MDP4685845.1 hypothetical protein [Salibacteraceae bacterium]MDP4763968.1 hypothetical protein [Salibacteraceae bacterium]MDP4843726.1 hypothetical protein [Salibacteraceae bacterium]MDP4934937.1 hypothetical protein [Salibacteraceae bacterium]